ncbi:Pimeloyl-ACP methyl ester carboxylesterase [Burkholderia sp. OK233]|nr:Pimeloyl-ACP methyl ester carboxylesterase [Burkholderia sp. OK233]
MKSFKLVGRGHRKVLLFPGLLGTRDAFDEMLRFADLDTFQYAIVEYRGYGESRGEPGLLTLRQVVVDAVRLTEYLEWPKFVVAGHSIGALAAQMLAVALPHRVDAIVSIAGASAKGASKDPERVRFMQGLAQSLEQRQALVKAGIGESCTDAAARAIASANWNDVDGNALASYAGDASRTDIHDQVTDLDAPILVLVGEHDAANSEAAARETTLKWYKRPTLQVLAGAGHYLPVEAPVATITAIERYLSQA